MSLSVGVERTFEGPVFEGGESLFGVTVGDLAGTGIPQIYASSDKQVTRLDGDGWKTSSTVWSSNSGPIQSHIVDLTADGAPDLVMGIPGSNESSGKVVILEGPHTEPAGWESPHVALIGTENSRVGLGLTMADLNGDGVVDLAAEKWVRFGPITEDVPFGAETDFILTDGLATRQGPIVAGDVDGDGLADLVVMVTPPHTRDCDQMPVELRVIPGPLSPGEFSVDDAPVVIPMPTDVVLLGYGWLDGTWLRVRDIDGDGAAEILTAGWYAPIHGPWTPELFIYSGPITDGAEPSVRFTLLGRIAAIADLNDDGALDVLLGDMDGHWKFSWRATKWFTPALSTGPLDSLPRIGESGSCEFHVDESWYISTLGAAWFGSLDEDDETDVVVASWKDVYVVPGEVLR